MNRRPSPNQCQKPTGWLGRMVLRRMNRSHSRLTDWGLSNVSIQPSFTILDIGCGGGRTISKLAAAANQGRVHGIDHSADAIRMTQKTNAKAIRSGCVVVQQGSVSELPFPDNTFDLVTAVETHYFWPNLTGDMREVFRTVRPGGTFLLIAEVYKGAGSSTAKLVEKYPELTGMALLTPDEHRQLLASAGYTNLEVSLLPKNGWICAKGCKP